METGNLNPPQVEGARSLLTGEKRGLLVMATGIGKTRTIQVPALVLKALKKTPILWVTHENTLLDQAALSWQDVYGVTSDRYIPGDRIKRDGVYHCSVQSLYRNREHLRLGMFRVVIIDEAHHVECAQYQIVIKALMPEYLFGATATNGRTDGRDLLKTFDRVAFEYTLEEGVRDGYLVPEIRAERVITGLDIKRVRTSREGKGKGDYSQRSLARNLVVPSRNKLVVKAYLRHGRRKAICFCMGVPHMKMMVKAFDEAGVRVVGIDGKLTKENRNGKIDAFKKGDMDVLCVVYIGVEGFDDPKVDMLLMTRPTKSHWVYMQMLGRGTRPGKDHLLIVDFVDVTKKNSLGEQQTAHKIFGIDYYTPKHQDVVISRRPEYSQVDMSKYKVVKFEKETLLSRGRIPTSKEDVLSVAQTLLNKYHKLTAAIWDDKSGCASANTIKNRFGLTIADIKKELGIESTRKIFRSLSEVYSAAEAFYDMHGTLTQWDWNKQSDYMRAASIIEKFDIPWARLQNRVGCVRVAAMNRQGLIKHARKVYEEKGKKGLASLKWNLVRVLGGMQKVRELLGLVPKAETDVKFVARAGRLLLAERKRLGRNLMWKEAHKLLGTGSLMGCIDKVRRLIPEYKQYIGTKRRGWRTADGTTYTKQAILEEAKRLFREYGSVSAKIWRTKSKYCTWRTAGQLYGRKDLYEAVGLESETIKDRVPRIKSAMQEKVKKLGRKLTLKEARVVSGYNAKSFKYIIRKYALDLNVYIKRKGHGLGVAFNIT